MMSIRCYDIQTDRNLQARSLYLPCICSEQPAPKMTTVSLWHGDKGVCAISEMLLAELQGWAKVGRWVTVHNMYPTPHLSD